LRCHARLHFELGGVGFTAERREHGVESKVYIAHHRLHTQLRLQAPVQLHPSELVDGDGVHLQVVKELQCVARCQQLAERLANRSRADGVAIDYGDTLGRRDLHELQLLGYALAVNATLVSF
jgi:hypothetical protein